MLFGLSALAVIAAVVLLFVLSRLRTSESFLQANGTAFSYAGQPESLYGSTMYPLIQDPMGREQRGSSWALSTFPSYIDYVLSLAQSAHLNTIRPTDYL